MASTNVAIDLLDQVKSYLSPDLVSKLVAYVGESPAAVQKGLGGIIPTLLAALSNQASTPSGAQELTRALDGGKYDGSALDNLGSLFSSAGATQNAISSGMGILDSLFGSKLSSVTDLVGRFAGLRASSTSSLLAVAAPIVMNVLGKRRASVGQSPSTLTALLGDQRNALAGLLPAGIGSLLGWSAGSDAPVAPREAYRPEVPPKRAPDRSRVLPFLILGLLVLAALAWLWGRESPSVREAGKAAMRMADVQLPGGVKISVPEGSFNYSLYQWLASTTDTAVPRRFVFDNLNFETGSTQLTPESVPTVESLIAIMKAYPATVIALEGYTDNTGDAAANTKLSLDRANAVKAIMVKGGVADGRISTNGYGPEKPIASNDTEEGRAKNRRTELVVQKR